MASKYTCFTRVFATDKTTFVFSLVMRFKCVSASVKTAFAFSFVWRYNICVSQACLHRLRRLLRFSSYRVAMHALHTLVCIFYDVFRVFLGACVSHACLHLLRRLSRFPRYGV